MEILLILFAVFIVISAILYLEDTLRQNTTWGNIFIKSLEQSRILGTFESISIVTALVIYMRRGKKKSHYEAWQVIDSAQGIKISHARIKALEELSKDGVSLKGLSLPMADLEQVTLVDSDFKEANLKTAKLQEANLKGSTFELTQLQGANLWKANLRECFFLLAQLQKANLSAANLQDAELQGVNLLEANLQRANLQRAYILGNLQGANFQEANLKGAILQGAYLQDANFRRANLRGANLKEANLQGVNFEGANLQGAHFQNATGLTPEQIRAALNWKQARYSKPFLGNLGLSWEQYPEHCEGEVKPPSSGDGS
ncbi:pentapeptide repeat-containing protein [Lyngbya sp. CCY1209]|uniref:pentapeptide repeat-containing protein n=1 Tax=Lyngbya sp. CCY1209 TaxID=2886103 RepID=UPI002D20C9CD|nr:pentapeptide repeat-containing protein [Lyngbya sp. CCY1209]MEB3882941.1 pentapeptide repeat-containing protein [Lyngbya sp. CCY1209]